VLVGPSLAGLATRTPATLSSPDYKGSAKTLEEYIHESIVNPDAYLVPGPTFSSGGHSVMPPFASVLKPEEIDHLVAYLATFK
jgi:nitric oxide reductase subunit C